MNIFLFLYSYLLTAVYAVLFFLFLFYYYKKKENFCLYWCLLFAVYILDNLLYAFFDSFQIQQWFVFGIFILSPAVMNLPLYWVYRLLISGIFDYQLQKWEFIFILLFSLFCVFDFPFAPFLLLSSIANICYDFYLLIISRLAIKHFHTISGKKKLLASVFIVFMVSLDILATIQTYRGICMSQIIRNPFIEIIGIVMPLLAISQLFKIVPESAGSFTEEELRAMFISHYRLTRREAEILPMLLAGDDNQTISEKSFISVSTTKVHLHNIYQKLSIEKRSQVSACYMDFCKTHQRKK